MFLSRWKGEGLSGSGSGMVLVCFARGFPGSGFVLRSFSILLLLFLFCFALLNCFATTAAHRGFFSNFPGLVSRVVQSGLSVGQVLGSVREEHVPSKREIPGSLVSGSRLKGGKEKVGRSRLLGFYDNDMA